MASTSTAHSVETERDLLYCSICLKIFENPKSLPCIHTFCLKCIRKCGANKHEGDRMTCPCCRSGFVVPKGGFEKLPDNFYLKKLVEFRKVSRKRKFDIICELCDCSAEATAFCNDCDQNVCESCSKIHKKTRVTMNHQVVAMNNQTKVKLDVDLYCARHTDRFLEHYCYDCEQTICLLCLFHNHKEHKSSDMEDAAKHFQERLGHEYAKVANSILALEKETVVLQDAEKNILHEITKKQQFVKSSGKELKHLIDVKLKEVDLQLDEIKSETVRKVAEQRTAVKSLIDRAKTAEKSAEFVMNEASSRVVTRCGSALLARLEGASNATSVNLEQERLDKVDVRVSPALESTVAKITDAFLDKMASIVTEATAVDDTDRGASVNNGTALSSDSDDSSKSISDNDEDEHYDDEAAPRVDSSDINSDSSLDDNNNTTSSSDNHYESAPARSSLPTDFATDDDDDDDDDGDNDNADDDDNEEDYDDDDEDANSEDDDDDNDDSPQRPVNMGRRLSFEVLNSD